MLSETLAKALAKSGNLSQEWLEDSSGWQAAVSDPDAAAVATADDEVDGDDRFVSALGVVVRHVRFRVRAEGAAIALAGPEGVRCRASCGYAPEPGVRLQPHSGVCGQCYATGEQIVWSANEGEASAGLCSVIAVPIRAGASTLGLIAAFSTSRNQFRSEQLPVLTRIADTLAQQLDSPAIPDPANAGVEVAVDVPNPAEPPVADLEAESRRQNPPQNDGAASPEVAAKVDQPAQSLAALPVPKRRTKLAYCWTLVVILALVAGLVLLAFSGSGQWLQWLQSLQALLPRVLRWTP